MWRNRIVIIVIAVLILSGCNVMQNGNLDGINSTMLAGENTANTTEEIPFVESGTFEGGNNETLGDNG